MPAHFTKRWYGKLRDQLCFWYHSVSSGHFYDVLAGVGSKSCILWQDMRLSFFLSCTYIVRHLKICIISLTTCFSVNFIPNESPDSVLAIHRCQTINTICSGIYDYSFIYRTWNCALTFLLLSQCSVLYPSSAQNVTTISWSLCGWFFISPGFFILRTYALWNNNKVILAVMLSTFAVNNS